MNNFFKLLNFEFNRFLKFYFILIAITIMMQITGVIIEAKSYMNYANEIMFVESISKATFLADNGQFSFRYVTNSLWFSGPIALCIVTLLIYLFFIWYRDWFGKNTFIYRLLILPTTRINLFLAKATTIFLSVLGLIALQLILLFVENNILQWLVPAEFRVDMSIQEIIGSLNFLEVLIPGSFIEFISYYGMGLMAIVVLFTAIIFERCFRWKGIVLGICYCLIAVFIFFSPVLIHIYLESYFYPLELIGLEFLAGLIVIAGSIWTSHYLLKNKIRV